jgi:hypothetical protein
MSRRNYDDEDFIPWYRRVTPTWLGLSIEARGALVSVAMHLNRATGALPLRKGLASLAVLLNVPWEKLEPAIAELIAEEKLGWDGARFVLFDPEHENRRRRTSADRMRDLRAKAKLPDSQPPSGNVTPSDACDVRDEHKTDVTGVTPPLSVSSVSSDLSSQRGEPERGPPDWFVEVVDGVCMDTGERFAAPEAWLRYSGHRATKGIAVNAQDARYWLGTVMVPEARKERRAESDRRLNQQRRDGPPERPKQSREEARREAQEFAAHLAARNKGAA